MATNDVPEYLNELIPYRCPKCGNLRRFATLRELRQHLQADHSFQMGCIKPHSRAQVFKGARESTGSSNFARSLSSEDKFSGRSSKYDTDPVNELQRDNNEYNGRKQFRDTSPLLKSFKEETELLEKELQQARQNEMKHKTQSLHALSESTINTDFKTSLEAIERTKFTSENKDRNFAQVSGTNYPINVQKNFVEKTKSRPSLSRGNFGSSHDFKSTLDSLNTEVMKSRMNQWVTTDALYKSQDLLKDMETAAEVKCQEQRKIIEMLVDEMKDKDVMLESRTKQQSELSTERQRLLGETESLVKQTDDYNNRLMHDLNGRGKILDGLNKELEQLKAQSQQEIKTKEYDLQHASQRIGELEWERDKLIQETDRILKQADNDTGRLRSTLQAKEEELKNVNETLHQLRSKQQSMLEKTMTVYRSSEESRDIMKTAIQTKDSQLQHAMKQIENMSSLHNRLVEQSQILTDQADDNTSSMKRLLHAKGEQIQDLVQQLDILKREKRHLEGSTLSLAEKAESSTSVVESLRDMVRQKECDLKTTQSELQGLKSFLKNAADKEQVARQKLEVFIEDLIQRAEIAESELHVLKSQSTDSCGTHYEGKPDFAPDIHQEDSTERKSLPSRIEPFNPKKATTGGGKTGKIRYETETKAAIQNDENTESKRLLADMHQVELAGGRMKTEAPSSAGVLSNVDDIVRIERNERLRLEGSGGFVAEEESDASMYDLKHMSDLNEDMHNAKHIHHSVKNKSYSENNSYDPSYSHSQEKTGTAQRHGDRKPKSEINKYQKAEENTTERPNKNRKKTGKYYTKRTNNVPDASTEDDETDSHSDSEHRYRRHSFESMTRKRKSKQISRGLQVGAFLSKQEITNIKEESSEYSPAVSSDENYSYNENTSYRRKYTQNPYYKSEGNMRNADRRPATMGKSLKNGSANKQNVRASIGRKKRFLNREFDTRFPTAHRSMVNIVPDKTELSEGEVILGYRERQRRSRSLSPRAFGARISYQTGEIEEESSDSSQYDDVPSENDDAAFQDKENVDRTDGVFNNIMDENGILWEDDMATLPDVSDSEFDRVSPSGSEALTTKNTCNTTTTVFSIHPAAARTTDSKDTTKVSVSKKDQSGVDDLSVSKVARLLNDKSTERDLRPESRKRISSSHAKQSYMKSSPHFKTEITDEELRSNPNETRTDPLSNTVRFRPIKSPPGSKGSTSERDLTSGGKEVKRIMDNSPKIDILGTTASDTLSRNNSDSYRRSNGRIEEDRQTIRRHSADTKPFDSKLIKERSEIVSSALPRRTSYKSNTEDKSYNSNYNKQIQKDQSESITDKIERISSKYSPKHQNRPSARENKTQMNLEERIKLINNKYKIRREDIFVGKGISQKYNDTSDSSMGSIAPYPLNKSFDERRTQNRNHGKVEKGKVPELSGIKPSDNINSPYGSSFSPTTFANNQGFENKRNQTSGFQDEAYRNHQHSDQQLMGFPYMQHPGPFPYPPNWSPYTPFPFHPEYASFIQQQQQQQQLLQQQQKSQPLEQQPFHQSEETASNKKKESVDLLGSQYHKGHKSDENSKEIKSRETEIKELERGHDIIVKANERQINSQLREQKPNILMEESDIETEQLSETTPQQTLLPVNTTGASYRRTPSDESCKIPQAFDTKIPETQVAQTDLDLQNLAVEKHSVEQASSPKSKKVVDKTDNSDATQYHIPHRDQINISENDIGSVTQSVADQDEEGQVENIIAPKANISNIEKSNHTADVIDKEIDVKPRLGLFEDTDNDETSFSMVDKSNLFAEEIGDESSTEYDSNTQSYLDLPGNVTDTDFDGDTDTESVRRDFYEKTQKIKDLIDGPHNDFADVYRHNVSRNTTSSASSQG